MQYSKSTVLRTVLAAGMSAAMVAAAPAADLLIETAPPVDTSFVNSGVYAQLLGGVTLAGDPEYYVFDFLDGSDPVLDGWAIAGTLGIVVMEGLSLEADLFHSAREEDDNPGENYATTSLMANTKYTLPLGDIFSVYGAAGLGLVSVDISEADLGGSGFGYQLIAGVGAQVTDNITLLGEYRYQNTFERIEIDDTDYELAIPTSTFLVGAKLSF